MHFSHWAINLMMWTGNNVRKEVWNVALHCWLAPAAGSTPICGSILKRGESCGGAKIVMSVPCKLDLLSQVLTSFAVTKPLLVELPATLFKRPKKIPFMIFFSFPFLFFFFYPPVPTVPALRSVHCTLIWCCLVLKNDFKNEGVAVWFSKASSMFSSILLRLNLIKTISIFSASPPFIMNCYFV